MKIAPLIMGTLALATGATYMSVKHPVSTHALSAEDVDFAWRISQGPNGEHRSAALPLYRAIIAQDEDNVKRLCDQGVSPNILLYPKQYSPVMVAIYTYNYVIVDALIKCGANLNYMANDFHGTVLFLAIDAAINESEKNDSRTIDYRYFWHLIDSGADINLAHRYTINKNETNEQIVEDDIANIAATLGQDKLVNGLLARGYHRDLPELLITLKVRVVDDKTKPETDKAITTVLHELAKPEHRAEIPALLDNLKKIIATQQPDRPSLSPGEDKEVVALERILKSS